MPITYFDLLYWSYWCSIISAVYGGAFVISYGMGRVIRAILIRVKGHPGPISLKSYMVMVLLLEGIASGILFETSFDHLLILLAGVVIILPLALMAGLLWAFWGGFEDRESGRKLKFSGLIWISFVFALGLFWGVGSGMNEWKIAAVRSYGERAVPVLEEIKHRDGVYPSKLPVSELGRPPTLLNYESDGTTFTISYINPADMFGIGSKLTSKDHHWTGSGWLD